MEPSTLRLINRKSIKEYLNRDSLNLRTEVKGVEATSTMKDSFAKQPYLLEENNNERKQIQAKHRKDTIVFGKDRANYFKLTNNRASTQEFANVSREIKEAAETVKQRLMAQNFKLGSYKPEYNSSSIAVDKVILSNEAKDEKYRQPPASKIKKMMSSTHNVWGNASALKSFDSQLYKSRSGFEAKENSERREVPQNSQLIDRSNNQALPSSKGVSTTKNTVFNEEKPDPNNPGSLSNSLKNNPKIFWEINRGNFTKTHLQKANANNPLNKKHHITEGFLDLREHQKSQQVGTTALESFKQSQVPSDDRMKDKEVHDFMKKQNVRLGNYNSNSQTEVKSSYQTYSKNTIDESNSDNKKNSNFKKSFFICGSPAREKPLESKLNMYGDGADIASGTANDLNQVNKQLKRNLLSHAFNLGYGRDTHKRVPSVDVTQGMRKCDEILKECETLKKKNEKQNFKYTENGDVKNSEYPIELNNVTNTRYMTGGFHKEKLPMDYWKTNFAFNQVEKKTGTGTLASSISDNLPQNHSKSTMGTSSIGGFAEIKGTVGKIQPEGSNMLQRNRAKSIKSSFTVGNSKGGFDTSYKNQFIWKVPKFDGN